MEETSSQSSATDNLTDRFAHGSQGFEAHCRMLGQVTVSLEQLRMRQAEFVESIDQERQRREALEQMLLDQLETVKLDLGGIRHNHSLKLDNLRKTTQELHVSCSELHAGFEDVKTQQIETRQVVDGSGRLATEQLSCFDRGMGVMRAQLEAEREARKQLSFRVSEDVERRLESARFSVPNVCISDKLQEQLAVFKAEILTECRGFVASYSDSVSVWHRTIESAVEMCNESLVSQCQHMKLEQDGVKQAVVEKSAALEKREQAVVEKSAALEKRVDGLEHELKSTTVQQPQRQISSTKVIGCSRPGSARLTTEAPRVSMVRSGSAAALSNGRHSREASRERVDPLAQGTWAMLQQNGSLNDSVNSTASQARANSLPPGREHDGSERSGRFYSAGRGHGGRERGGTEHGGRGGWQCGAATLASYGSASDLRAHFQPSAGLRGPKPQRESEINLLRPSGCYTPGIPHVGIHSASLRTPSTPGVPFVFHGGPSTVSVPAGMQRQMIAAPGYVPMMPQLGRR